MNKSNKNNFGTKFKKLEEIVNKLEEENVDLDEAIELYKEGNALSKELEKELKEVISNFDSEKNEE